jgi:hypothetical protein
LKPYQYVKGGKTGNPHGRPKGSRNKFSKRFFEDARDVWEEGGLEILKAAAIKNPVAFARFMAHLASTTPVEPVKTGATFRDIWEHISKGTMPPVKSPMDRAGAAVDAG